MRRPTSRVALVRDAQAQDAATRRYIQETAASSSPADEIAKLADLRDRGVIDDADFQRLKAKIIGSPSGVG